MVSREFDVRPLVMLRRGNLKCLYKDARSCCISLQKLRMAVALFFLVLLTSQVNYLVISGQQSCSQKTNGDKMLSQQPT